MLLIVRRSHDISRCGPKAFIGMWRGHWEIRGGRPGEGFHKDVHLGAYQGGSRLAYSLVLLPREKSLMETGD